MFRTPNRAWIATLIGLSLSACGKPTHSPFAGEKQRLGASAHRAPVTGDLAPLVEKFFGAPGLGPCEERNLSSMLKIARELDERQDEISAYARTLPNSEKIRRIKVGPLTLTEPVVPPEPKSGWKIDIYGWPGVLKAYDGMRDGGTPAEWYWLNSEVRGILPDDEDRILNEVPLDIGHADEAPILEIQTAIKSCLKVFECEHPSLSTANRAWMRGRYPYAQQLSVVDSGTLGADAKAKRRSAMSKLESLIDRAARRFKARPNLSVKRSGNELVLPMFAGPFAAVQAEIAERVESVWKSDALHLKIDWKTAETPSVFQLMLAEGTGGRPWVNTFEKVVMYYSDMPEKNLAHEFGHVLGFPDRYYTLWDESKCEYSEEYREDDLMSVSSMGAVLDSDWKTLQELYPVAAVDSVSRR